MPTYTPRNNLAKPLYSDAADIVVLNGNTDIIDECIAKGNYSATTAPTVNDDAGDGFAPGSLWVDTSAHDIYICEVSTVGAAVWTMVNSADLSNYLKADGSVPLTAKWDAGPYQIQAETFHSDVVTGTPPFTVVSTTQVANLNCSSLNGVPDVGFVQQTLADAKGDLIVATGPDTFTRLAVGSNSEALISYSGDTSGVAWAKILDGASRQMLINGDFIVNQYGIPLYTSSTQPANSDDTYLHDQWVLLSDGNDIVAVSYVDDDVPTSHAGAVKFAVNTANKKFGYIQFIENKNSIPAIGGLVSLKLWAKTTLGNTIPKIRAAILSWNGSKDSLTSDVVSAWGLTGANFTPVANWTIENTPVDLNLTTSWQEFKIENVAIDTAGTVNLAVFIWCDSTDTPLGSELLLSGVQLNVGHYSLSWSSRDYVTELLKCRRYLQVINAEAGSMAHLGAATCFWSPAAYCESLHSTEWFKDAAIITKIGKWRMAGSTIIAIDRFVSECIKPTTVVVAYNDTVGFIEGRSYIVYTDNDSTARLYIESRL